MTSDGQDFNDRGRVAGLAAVRADVDAAAPVPSEHGAGVADLAAERKRKRQQTKAAAPAAADSTHHDLALAWVASKTVSGHAPVYAGGAIHAPGKAGLWELLTLEAVQVQVASQFNGCKLCKKHSDYKQIAAHIAALTEQPDFFESAPAGVASPAGFHRLSESGSVETVELELEHRQTFALGQAPEYEAEAPLIDALLASAFDNDHPAEQTDLWWQGFGAALFALLPRLQVALLMIGVHGSGKSTLQRVLEAAFPRDAVCAVSPQQWGHEYHVAALANKRLNVVGELADDSPIPAAPFKNVTGLNLVGARNPTHRPFSFRSTAAHVFASNVLPPTTDRSEAFYRRWRVLRFSNTVPPERVDHQLLDKIVATEMPAILAAAFLGAERAARAGALRTTAAHASVMDKWRHAANPLQQFLADDEWIELDPSAQEHTPREVYAAYRRWSAVAGFRNPFGRNHFLDLLESTGAARGVSLRRVGTRQLAVGLRLIPQESTP